MQVDSIRWEEGCAGRTEEEPKSWTVNERQTHVQAGRDTGTKLDMQRMSGGMGEWWGEGERWRGAGVEGSQ